MRKVFVGLLAVGGLLASVLVAVATVVSPASAQVDRAGLVLSNTMPVREGTSAGDPVNQARFVVSPLSGCEPGAGGGVLLALNI